MSQTELFPDLPAALPERKRTSERKWPETLQPVAYREVGARDTTTPGCCDCDYLAEDMTVPISPRKRPQPIFSCEITGAEVDPDYGTCGRCTKRAEW